MADVSDIERFWAVFDRAESAAQLQTLYFATASRPWREHLAVSGHPEYFRNAFRDYRRFYETARPGTLRVTERVQEIEHAMDRLRQLYASNPVPVTLGIGRAHSAGRGYGGRVYLAAEMFARGQGADMSSLPGWAQRLTSPPEAIAAAAVHEAVHVFQPPVEDPVLLVACLREGAASFVAELVTGRPLHPELEAWCRPRAESIFADLARQAGSTNYSSWLYNAQERPGDRPADVGYWAGSEIARDVYVRAGDKRSALRDIIDMHDPRALVRASRYRWMVRPQTPVRARSSRRGAK